MKIFIITILLFFPLFFAQARSLSDVKIVISDTIVEDCQYAVKDVKGCYFTPNKIYISSQLSFAQLTMVFLHEIGHFLMDGTSVETYNKLFNPFSFTMPLESIQEIAAQNFVVWWITNQATPEQEQFFIGLFK